MSMLRISSSKAKAVVYAVGAISGTLTNGFKQNSCRHLCTAAIAKCRLLEDINSEIKLNKMSLERGAPGAIPKDFPFVFRDNPRKSHFILCRDFDGEKIGVTVHIRTGDPSERILHLSVRVSKQNGKILQFPVRAFADGRISIIYVELVQPAPEILYCLEEGSELEIAFIEFLKVRGMDMILKYHTFLYDYMVNTQHKRPLLQLRKLTKFLAG